MVRHLTQVLHPENWLARLKTIEFTNLPPSFFEKSGLIEDFLEKNIINDCYLEDFDFCVLANEEKGGGTQKLILRNLVVATLRLIFFYYRYAELSADLKYFSN
jgi:hypothetical protein